MKKQLPKHLKIIIDEKMKTDSERKKLAKLIGAKFYKNKKGKIIEV